MALAGGEAWMGPPGTLGRPGWRLAGWLAGSLLLPSFTQFSSQGGGAEESSTRGSRGPASLPPSLPSQPASLEGALRSALWRKTENKDPAPPLWTPPSTAAFGSPCWTSPALDQPAGWALVSQMAFPTRRQAGRPALASSGAPPGQTRSLPSARREEQGCSWGWGQGAVARSPPRRVRGDPRPPPHPSGASHSRLRRASSITASSSAIFSII